MSKKAWMVKQYFKVGRSKLRGFLFCGPTTDGHYGRLILYMGNKSFVVLNRDFPTYGAARQACNAKAKSIMRAIRRISDALAEKGEESE